MESPLISDQQMSCLAGQLWECTTTAVRKSGSELAETVHSLGALSFSIERLQHSRIGEMVQVGRTYWRRIE